MKNIEHRRDGRGTVSFRRDASHALDEATPVWGTGPGKGPIPIALVGDMPSEDDLREGLPFSGSIGKFLSWGLSEASIYRPKMWLTNVFSRRSPDGDIQHPNVQDAIESELSDFQREIRYLVEERGTKVLLLAGGAAVEAFNLAGTISHLRGSVYVWNTRTWTEATRQTDKTVLLVPTYHPGYLMRNRWTRSGKGRADFTAVWLDDLDKARRISVDGWNPPRERFNVEPTLAEVTRYVEDRIQDQRLIAVDIETTGFDPKDAGIVCIGLAHSKEDALVVPLIDGPGSYYWTPGQGQEVKALLSRLFSEGGGLVLQNALFDVPFLREKGFVIPSGAVKHDTLLLHHAVSPELPHKLGFIVSQYGDTPYWKDEFQNRDTTIVRMDQRTLRTYNARDCVVLLQVLPGLLEDLEEVGSSDVYYNESIALVEPILEMMSTGVEFDTRGQTATRQKIQRELNDVETQLRTLGGLPDAFNIGSDDDLRLFLFGIASKKYLRGEDYSKKKPGTKVRKQLEELYSVRHDTTPLYLPRGFKGRRTDKGQVTVNKQGRLSYQRHLQNRLSEIESFKKIHPKHAEEKTAIEDTLSWLALYQKWSELSKILSTYLDYPIGEDGRVHTRFLIHGTATGRLSCVAGDTEIITDRGTVSIEEFDPASGARVLTHRGNWKIVKRKLCKGIDQMHRLTLESGDSIVATEDHRVLVRDGFWKCLRDIKEGEEVIHVNSKEVTQRSEDLREDCRRVSQRGKAYYRVYREEVQRDSFDSVCGNSKGTAEGTYPGREISSILTFEDGTPESDDRENWGASPQLDRGMLRRQRLFNHLGPWEAVFSPSSGHGGDDEHSNRELSKPYGGTSHRWKSREQRFEQSCSRNETGTQESPQSYAKVVEKTFMGALFVWDLEVEDDHSYFAGGVFNHNSQKPNLQNQPKSKSSEIRRLFVAEDGHSILAADYSNLEVKVMAYETRDTILIDIVDGGKNMHDVNTRTLFHLEPSDDMWGPARRAAKIFMFGSLAYGGGDNEIYEKVILDVPELKLTFREFVEAKKRYMDSHPEYVTWKENLTTRVQKMRQVSNAFGRVRTFYGNSRDIVKEALNFPIQSAAASIINRATIRIHSRLRQGNYLTRLQAQIHDELRFEVPNDELESVAAIVKEEMERPVDFHGIERRFQVEMEVGPNWSDLEEYML